MIEENYIHNHDVDYSNVPHSFDYTFILINYLPVVPTPKQLIRYNKVIASHTPLISHIINLYIHNRLKVNQTILKPTPFERKIITSTLRRIENDDVFANYYIVKVYIPSRIGCDAPRYRKLLEFITNANNYDFTNPSIWVYNNKLEYYILKPNILYSLDLPIFGPTFWICKNARDKYISLIEICSVHRCIECRKKINITIDPIMMLDNNQTPYLNDIRKGNWKFILDNIQD